MFARRAEETELVVSRSIGRMTPRMVMIWFSEFTFRLRVPSTTRFPFTSTCVTRAVMVAVKVVSRLVVPSPSSEVLLLAFNRFASAPIGAFGPASEVTAADAEEAREVLDCPVLTADADSAT